MLVNMTTASRFDAEVQECRACAMNEYIVDPNKGYRVDSACKKCPVSLLPLACGHEDTCFVFTLLRDDGQCLRTCVLNTRSPALIPKLQLNSDVRSAGRTARFVMGPSSIREAQGKSG
eukprot:3036144-Rhodomonas_salina.3